MKTSELVAWNCKSFTYVFLGFRPTYERDMKLKSKKSYISIKKSSKSYNIPHTNLIQDSFKIEAKVMETSDSMAWECNLSHMSLLYFDPHRLWTLNYKLIHHIWISYDNPTHIISLIQIRYKITSRLKPNPWRQVIQKGMSMQDFHTCISDISTYRECGHNITETYIIYLFPITIKLI